MNDFLITKNDIAIYKTHFSFTGRCKCILWISFYIAAAPLYFLFDICQFFKCMKLFTAAFHIWHFATLIYFLIIINIYENVEIFGIMISSVCFILLIMFLSLGIAHDEKSIQNNIWFALYNLSCILLGINFCISIYFAITANFVTDQKKNIFLGFYFGTAVITIPGLSLISAGLFIICAPIEFIIRLLIRKLTFPVNCKDLKITSTICCMQLKSYKYSSFFETISCSICMERFDENDSIIKIHKDIDKYKPECSKSHLFHEECLRKIAYYKSCCPICCSN